MIRSHLGIIVGVVLSWCFGIGGAAASASTITLATDNSANYSSGGWGPGTSQGTGWGGAWTFRNQSNVVLTTTNGNRGWFRGDSRNNNSGGITGDSNGDFDINTPSSSAGTAWGIYSNTTDHVYAIRPFAHPLAVGQTVTWLMDNGNISTSNVVGVRLLSNTSDANSRVFEARFVGGQSNYTVFDSLGERASTLGFTREGLRMSYTLTGPSSYSITITRLVNNQSQTITGTNVNASAVTGLAFRNQLAGSGAASDAFFNSISIERPNAAPTVDDHTILNVPQNSPDPVTHTFTANDPDGDSLTWSNFQFVSYTAGYGDTGSGPALAATFNPNTQAFNWDVTGSPRGVYVWQVTASDIGSLFDDGTLTVHVVPEAASLAWLGLALLGVTRPLKRARR